MAKSSVLKQALASVTCNLLTFSCGSTTSWGGANFMLLTSKDTPLDSGPLSTSEASLAVSIPCLGSIIGILIYTVVMDRCSRKLLLVSVAISQLLSWTMLLVVSNLYSLYAARLMMGVVLGGAMKVIPIFVSEIAEDRIRGGLNSMLVLFCNAGFLFGLVIPSYFNYFGQIKANMLFPTLFMIFFNFFPETPEYLMKRNQRTAAEKSRSFYTGINNSPSVENENLYQPDKVYKRIANENTSLSLADFCNPAAKKAIIIALCLGLMNQFCGAFAMSSYTNKIFEDAGSTLPSSTAAAIVGAVQLLANCITMVLVDRAGRKILMILSTLGTAIGLISMGLYELYKVQLDAHRWIPIVAFSTVILMASIGIFPLTFVILSEIVPVKIKNVVSFLCLESIYVIAFGLLSFYPILTQEIGSHNCMFIFAASCLVGTVFFLIVLPETNGKSYDEIIKLLEK